MSEIGGKVRKGLIELIYPFVSGTYGGVDWGKLMGITESTVDKILSIPEIKKGLLLYEAAEKGEMAIVDRDEVLIGVLESLSDRLDADKDLAEIKAIGYVLDMLKEGGVKEKT